VREYLPSGCPGARLPHAWTERAGERASVLDLLRPERFTLIAGGRGGTWVEAARALAAPPLDVLALGRDVADADGTWAAALGIGPGGALLVRPDQHVAWRSAGPAGDPGAALRGALSRILGT
jgi:hypothetical protein